MPDGTPPGWFEDPVWGDVNRELWDRTWMLRVHGGEGGFSSIGDGQPDSPFSPVEPPPDWPDLFPNSRPAGKAAGKGVRNRFG